MCTTASATNVISVYHVWEFLIIDAFTTAQINHRKQYER